MQLFRNTLKTIYYNLSYKLVKLNPQSGDHLKMLRLFQSDSDVINNQSKIRVLIISYSLLYLFKFDVWNGIDAVNQSVEVSLSPSSFKQYQAVFERTSLPYEIVNENIQRYI